MTPVCKAIWKAVWLAPLGAARSAVAHRPRTRGVASGAAFGVALAVAVGLVLPPAPGRAASNAAAQPTERVIVQDTSTGAAAAAVRAVGGRVTRSLALVDGVAATLPAGSTARLAAAAGVRAVTADRRMHVEGGPDARDGAGSTALPKSVYGAEVGAPRLAAQGYHGQGVTVALLDTGITSSQDLRGRVLPVTDDVTGTTAPCENLSGESTCADGYGHGTFLAGIIAGNGAASSGRYQGIAPKANLVSIKVGAADGSADVSNVLAGIQWAVSFKDRYHIRVLNLSLGTDSTQSWQVDPLNYAVERAWAAGIVVVVSASNLGPQPGTISKPGDDPWVVTVGAVDDRGTTSISDDWLPDFSGRGPTAQSVAKPDVVAPGAHLVSLRAPGSTIDTLYPDYVAGAYHRGSGTSMSAAVVSGVAAQLLSAKPAMTPNRLKYTLINTAHPVAGAGPSAIGRGLVDGYAALHSAGTGTANGGLARSNGTGLLEASRGNVHVSLDDPRHTVVNGVLTAQLVAWDPAGFVTGQWTASSWYTTTWYLTPWFSTAWYGDDWTGHNWEGCSWGSSHDTSCSYGHNWEGAAWYGAWD